MNKGSIFIPGPQGQINLWTRIKGFFDRNRKKAFAYPYILWMALFVVIPIFLVMVYAFTKSGGGFTLSNFSGMGVYAPVFGRSLWLAFLATAICLLIGYPVALAMSRLSPRMQRIVLMLLMLPMWINFLLRTYAWMSILENTGLLNRFFQAVGIIDLSNLINGGLNSLLGLTGEQLLPTDQTYFQMINTGGAVVLGMVYNYLPFMILPIHSVIIKIDPFVIEAAQDLGASRKTVFRKVILPLSLSGVISGVTMVFVPSVSTFVISKLLGGGTDMLLGDLIEMQFLGAAYNPHLGSAISLIMMAIVVVCMSIMNKFGEGEESAVVM